MPDDYGAVVCPNPKCHRKIEEPILLSNLSTTPAEQYYACSHCLMKLENARNDEDITQESKHYPPLHLLHEKVTGEIFSAPKPQKKEELQVRRLEEKEKDPVDCPHNFGYLGSRAEGTPIPQECLICPRIVDCMLKLSDVQ